MRSERLIAAASGAGRVVVVVLVEPVLLGVRAVNEEADEEPVAAEYVGAGPAGVVYAGVVYEGVVYVFELLEGPSGEPREGSAIGAEFVGAVLADAELVCEVLLSGALATAGA